MARRDRHCANGIPTYTCIRANVHALARYAALCQAAQIVPIVEPEVLMDSDHDVERCATVTELVLKLTFEELSPSIALRSKASCSSQTW
jgi:fructose-bisphosphate aldolase class I